MEGVTVSEFPENDSEFRDTAVAEVCDDGSITDTDGWSFFVPEDSPVAPEPGMAARFYGRGVGFPVRGLFLAGRRVFYRTADEQDADLKREIYGADAADWLRRWDDGQGVWSIEMGGIGPGYEQAIQITVAETVRHLLAEKYDHAAWSDIERWTEDREKIQAAAWKNATIDALGLSGAQWGAALSLATALYAKGPIAVLTANGVEDRKIQVSRTFPTARTPGEAEKGGGE